MPRVWRAGVDKLFQVGVVGIQELARGAARSVFERKDPPERIERLKEQLRRQSAQLGSAESREDLTGELAEMLELVFELGRARGISAEQLELRRRARQQTAAASAPASGSLFEQMVGIERFHPQLSRRLGALSGRLVRVAKPAADGGSVVLRRAVPGARLRIRRARTLIGKRARALRSFAGTPPRAVPIEASSSSALTLSRARRLPVAISAGGSTAAVWLVSFTSRAMFRYVVRPYLVRYLASEDGGRLDRGSRALIRLMLPSIAN